MNKLKKYWNMLFGFNTLYSKVALVFWILILALGGTEYYLLANYSTKASREHEQRLHWNVAEYLAEEIRPLLRENPESREAKEIVAKWSFQHAAFDIHVLDQRGHPVFNFPNTARSSSSARDSVDLEPIRYFLSDLPPDQERDFPILGEDPYNSDVEEIFSAAKLRIGNQPGYLYVLLRSNASQRLMFGIKDKSAIYSGSLAAAILTAFTALLGSVMFFYVTKRFRMLRSSVSKIAAGDLTLRAADGGDDEIGQLGREVNKMADTIVEKIDQLRKSDQLRREMVANIAHDLGSPLTLAMGYIERASGTFNSLPEETSVMLRDASKNLQAIRQLTADLFELSKIDAGDVKPQLEVFSLLDLLTEEIAPKIQQRAEAKGIQIELELCDTLALVNADIRMLDRVLTNLIENAIRYNKEKGSVTVRVIDNGTKVRCEVEDTGIGIPEQHLEKIFERSHVVDKARTRGVGGSGLGLAIVKEMLSLHGEEIKVQSVEGEGTTFSFELPSGTYDK